MWVYDQVFPEYIISYNEIHLKDQWNAIKETVSQSGYIAAILLMIGVFYYGNAAPRVSKRQQTISELIECACAHLIATRYRDQWR